VSWLSWHERSEGLASDGHTHARLGEHERARSLFAAAAEAESNALAELDLSKVRTVGITTVSAVSLWFKARQFAQAESIVVTGVFLREWLFNSRKSSFVHLRTGRPSDRRSVLAFRFTAATVRFIDFATVVAGGFCRA
jgi:hypothetical protein